MGLFLSMPMRPLPAEARDAFREIWKENKLLWSVTLGLSSSATLYYAYTKWFAKMAAAKMRVEKLRKQRRKRKSKTDVNKKFIEDLKKLIKLAVPGVFSKEVATLATLGFFLCIRTMLSIRLAHVNGTIVKAIVERKFWQFITRLATLASIAIPASFVNSWLTYYTAKLALQFRTRLMLHFHDLYLRPMMYYKVSNIDARINNPDQALTETITLWGRALSELYNNLTKPVLDIVLYTQKLVQLMGWEAPGTVVLYYMISILAIRFISPPFGAYAAMTQNLEGNFRSMHHRLITHSEEIAFYGGHDREKELLNGSYAQLQAHHTFVMKQKFGMGALNGFLQKYGSVMMGYGVLGLPVFGAKSAEYLELAKASSEITQDYIRNSGLLINLSKAIGRIVTSYESVQRLAGYTKLVAQLQKVLRELGEDHYVRQFVNSERLAELKLAPNNGERRISNNIRFDEVSVITPNGDILVTKTKFELEHGKNLMIVGPNGCGKSSLFRIMGGLWPVWDGVLHSPGTSAMFYIPQKPYLAHGTMKHQLIYPDNDEMCARKGFTDEKLLEILGLVKLKYLLGKHGGWHTVKDWMDVLSGGEKQRVAMARVFYHKPKFAILDECTSAVSVDVEGHMYTHCKEIGITLITISHRPSLWKYHEMKLEMDGRGGFRFGEMVLPKDYSGVP